MSRQKKDTSPEFKKNKPKTSKIALKNEKRTDTKTNLVCYCINSFISICVCCLILIQCVNGPIFLRTPHFY